LGDGCGGVSADTDFLVRRALNDVHPDEGQPGWIHLPIAEAQLLSSRVEIPRYCETARHQGKRRIATTFHAVVSVRGEPDRAWVACGECTSLMMRRADVTRC
jgi:hypothetical protein